MNPFDPTPKAQPSKAVSLAVRLTAGQAAVVKRHALQTGQSVSAVLVASLAKTVPGFPHE